MKTRIPIEFDTGIYLYAAAALLLLPLKWFLAACAAAFLHEIAHILVLKARRIPIKRISVGVGGARIYTGYQSDLDQLLSAAAGPVSGFLMCYCFRKFPVISICCLVQSLFNMLPVYPFDGGRILKSICTLVFGERNCDRVCFTMQIILFAAILVFIIHMAG